MSKLSSRSIGIRMTFIGFLASALVLSSTRSLAQFVGNTSGESDAVDKRVDLLLAKMTLDEKIDFIAGDTPFRTRPIPRLNIPFFQMADGPIGAHIPAPTIAYAAGINLAATWDTTIAKQIGEQLGRDSRSRGAALLLGPGVNIYRAPMNGRNYEYFGEDPYLAAQLAVQYIHGVQSQGVSATVKHFLGNNSEYLRHESDSIIDERTLREIYLPAFEASVKSGKVGSIMDSYNLTNGEYMSQNRHLNVDVAKGDWNFRGFIMSDWVATYDTTAAVMAGLDLEMPFGTYFNRETLLPLLKSGAITQAEIDDKVRRILRVAVDFGWLDHPQLDTSIPRYNLEGRAVSLQAATEGAVLLQNENHALPLKRDEIKTVALIGPTATQTISTAGGSGQVISFTNTNLLVGLSNYLEKDAKVLYARGIYSIDQMARLTRFTIDPQGDTPGVRRIIYARTNLEGGKTSTLTERGMYTSGETRREAEEQEINALNVNRNSFPYLRSTTSSRWTGYYTSEETADYGVFVQTDGRYKLRVDDALIFDSSVVPKYLVNQTQMALSKGSHKIDLELLSQPTGSISGMRVGIVPMKTIVEKDALEIASKADVVVLAVGFTATSEAEGSDRTFELPIGQEELIQQVAAMGKKTIVLITSGGSVDVSRWKDKVQGVFETWYAGEAGGTAAAQLLFGEADPSGHLPISWEKKITDNPSYANYYPDNGSKRVVYREGIFMGYRGYQHNHTETQYPFGYGLSYTTFSFGNLKSEEQGDGRFAVSFDVKNTGNHSGATVAQLYVGEASPTVDRPASELKAFERVDLLPGVTRRVTLNLDPRSFSFFDVKTNSWHANAGSYNLMLGDSSQDISQRTTVQLRQPLSMSVKE